MKGHGCDLRAKPQHCVAASHRKNLRRRTTHRENFRCAVLSYDSASDEIFVLRHCIVYIVVRRRTCDASSHRKNLRRRATHRGNFLCNMTSDYLLCDVVFATRRRNAALWPRPKSVKVWHSHLPHTMRKRIFDDYSSYKKVHLCQIVWVWCYFMLLASPAASPVCKAKIIPREHNIWIKVGLCTKL